jgi:tetratricopeptide (TPR) repeat protein
VPDDPLAWMYLARLYLANHAFELCVPNTPIEAALAAADRAVLIDPTSVRMRCTLAAALVVRGDIEAALKEIEQAQRANGESLAYRETIGWLAALAGDWSRGVALIRDATARNPFCPAHARQALWADCLRRGELETSYVAALEYHDATSFWRELMSACSLGHLRRAAEAHACAAELLRIKPDFPRRAHALIAHYIKSPDLRQLIAAGLCKAGVPLAA